MKGLNKDQVNYRINNGLVNDEKINNTRSIKDILKSNILTLFNFIHISFFILVLTTGAISNTIFIFSIFINTIIGICQEIKAKKILEKLTIVSANKIKVIRDDLEMFILPTEIVVDDLLVLTSGDTLVVDAKVVEAINCEVDESVITGESKSIIKKTDDSLISGSIIISGKCYAKVTSINRNTYANNLIKEASSVCDDSSYLKKNINIILKIIAFLIIPVGVMLFITQFFYSNQSYSESVLSSVAGVIGMIPDGLILLTSVSLTVGVIKMASKKVIIQKLNGIELLSCVDILCLDKTGTITDGTMEVVEFINLKNDDKYNEVIANMLNDEVNATGIAMAKYFGQSNNLEVIEKISFSSSRKYSKVKFKNGEYLLGALDYISNYKVNDFECLDLIVKKGFRILAFGKCKDKFSKESNQILGFVILKDNIRKNAKDTIDYFEKQDVEIKIISGDDPASICNLLKQIEFRNADKFISGSDLPDNINDLLDIVNNYSIFGRVTPYQKQNIIRALRRKKTVGMIGDGVNDILALKESDCGIALASGISAARSVSEVVLTDSDFGILPQIVNEGRRVVNNIERVASMYLIKTIYSFLISILCIIFAHEYPFYPIQLTLIGIVCVGIPSFFLAIEPNYQKVKKGFFVKVFRNALPSGLCVALNVFFIIMITDIFKLDYEMFRIVVVATTGYLNLRLIYKVSIPLNLSRKILLFGCGGCFYLLLFILSDFLLIKEINLLSIVLIGVFIFSSNYITDFFEEIYDLIIKYLSNKRSKKYE